MRGAGAACGSVEREWGAFAKLLLAWARSPASLGTSLPRLHRTSTVSTTTTTTTGDPAATPPNVTPGGSVDSSSPAAWDALLHSQQHRHFSPPALTVLLSPYRSMCMQC